MKTVYPPQTKFVGHLELQREITLIEMAPSPYFFFLSICLAYMNMFARFDENPAMTLQDIKKTKRYRRMHARTHNVKTVYPPQTKFEAGIIKKILTHGSYYLHFL